MATDTFSFVLIVNFNNRIRHTGLNISYKVAIEFSWPLLFIYIAASIPQKSVRQPKILHSALIAT